MESILQDQEPMEGFPRDLDARELSADTGPLCTTPSGISYPMLWHGLGISHRPATLPQYDDAESFGLNIGYATLKRWSNSQRN